VGEDQLLAGGVVISLINTRGALPVPVGDGARAAARPAE
jgi:hypothetical protein